MPCTCEKPNDASRDSSPCPTVLVNLLDRPQKHRSTLSTNDLTLTLFALHACAVCPPRPSLSPTNARPAFTTARRRRRRAQPYFTVLLALFRLRHQHFVVRRPTSPQQPTARFVRSSKIKTPPSTSTHSHLTRHRTFSCLPIPLSTCRIVTLPLPPVCSHAHTPKPVHQPLFIVRPLTSCCSFHECCLSPDNSKNRMVRAACLAQHNSSISIAAPGSPRRPSIRSVASTISKSQPPRINNTTHKRSRCRKTCSSGRIRVA